MVKGLAATPVIYRFLTGLKEIIIIINPRIVDDWCVDTNKTQLILFN